MDWRLQPHKPQLTRRLYGRTKPSTLMKHHIPPQDRLLGLHPPLPPGFTEVDLVAHFSECTDREPLQSLKLTDIHAAWVETWAVMGRGQTSVQKAVEQMREVLSFARKCVDPDNGSAFINAHL